MKVSPSWGFEVKFTAGKIQGKQAVDVSLAVSIPWSPFPKCCFELLTDSLNGNQQSASFPIGEPLCFGYNEKSPNAASGLPGKPASPSASGSKPTVRTSAAGPKPTPPGSSGGGNSCTVKTTGKKGTCMPTAVCKDSNGDSTPGYCPNDPTDVQVNPFVSVL